MHWRACSTPRGHKSTSRPAWCARCASRRTRFGRDALPRAPSPPPPRRGPRPRTALPPPRHPPLPRLQAPIPPVNTVCPNVPGPRETRYLLGEPVQTMIPLVPLAVGIGLGFAILSYADQLVIGINADAERVPNAWPLADA